ncbi:putative senescence regulator S40 [Rosa chinensis]|uniref:Putative senescence regulator S40 n=1 Tax=Rosa chinensis TaxID=74649 RepID=A0A2P6QE83_ROSCH|nr:uncharacterized protein LOC112166719 [Rosa chinensis]PRQ32469.1 putative senescence regulator S40 [Rosa chinensis]
MDIPNPTRLHRPNKSSPSERFLGAYPHAPPSTNANSSPDVGDELTEDDILWTNDFAAESSHHHHNSSNNNHSTPPSSASSTPRRHHKGFSQPESFGILAALPERESSSPNARSNSHFYHKASASSSSSSSPSYAQMIPTIPKPPPLQDHHRSFSSSLKYQSAPVNIPVLASAMRKQHELEAVVDEEDDNDDDDDDGEMLPPHEIVARSSAHSPMLACSVLEGVGRTLKGRDLRRVRNAVWRRTGFLD